MRRVNLPGCSAVGGAEGPPKPGHYCKGAIISHCMIVNAEESSWSAAGLARSGHLTRTRTATAGTVQIASPRPLISLAFF